MFRWKRALLHALIPFALTVVAGLVLFVVTNPVDPEKAGEGVGQFSFAMFCVGLGVSWLAQTGRKKAAWGVSLSMVALVGILVVLVATTPPARHAHRVDRGALIEEGNRLKHPTLHFSIARPPASYHLSPKMAEAMGIQDPDTVIYAYAEDPPQAGLLLSVLFGVGDLPGAIAGIHRGVEASQQNVEWIQDTIVGDEAHLHATVAGVHMKINAYKLPEAIVTITTITRDGTTLGDVLSSFRR